MIDLYHAPTPNTCKVSIMLEECGLPYRLVPVDVMAGDQHKREFLAVNPNGRVPAIVDQEGTGRLYRVMEGHLATNEWLAGGAYGIADMASWGWVWFHPMHGQNLKEFPSIARWFYAISARPAVARARALGLESISEEARARLTGPYYGANASS